RGEAPVPQAAQVRSRRKAPSLQAPHRKQKLAALIVALIVIFGSGVSYILLRSSGAAATPSVAVLPFDDLGQRSQDYFASGVSEEILNLLAHQQTMKVLGRISAEQLARGTSPLSRARELGVG